MPEPVRTHQLWVDIETTGLNPESCIPIEIGLRLAGRDGGEITTFTGFAMAHEIAWAIQDASCTDALVINMHRQSGLVRDYADEISSRMIHGDPVPFHAAHGFEELDKKAWAWLENIMLGVVGCEPGSMPMFGSSVAFDRSFLDKYLPRTASMFHYRNVDASAMRELIYQSFPDLKLGLDAYFGEARGEHRPQSDIDDSINLMKKMVTLLDRGIYELI